MKYADANQNIALVVITLDLRLVESFGSIGMILISIMSHAKSISGFVIRS